MCLLLTSKCTCPVMQGVGRVAKCMLMCMHGSYTINDCITELPSPLLMLSLVTSYIHKLILAPRPQMEVWFGRVYTVPEFPQHQPLFVRNP